MSEETQKNVPVADAPKESVSTEIEKDAKTELLVALSPPLLAIDIKGIDPKKLEMAKDLGIPIGEILNWVEANQKWQQNITTVLVNVAEANGKVVGFLGNLEKAQSEQAALQKKRQEAMQTLGIPDNAQIAAMPQQQSGSLGSLGGLIQLLPQLLNGGAATPTSNMNDLTAKIVEKAMNDFLNPAPSALEKVGEMFLEKIASKTAASLG
jgi:hypothetical protein